VGGEQVSPVHPTPSSQTEWFDVCLQTPSMQVSVVQVRPSSHAPAEQHSAHRPSAGQNF